MIDDGTRRDMGRTDEPRDLSPGLNSLDSLTATLSEETHVVWRHAVLPSRRLFSFFLSLTNARTHTAHTKFARRRCVSLCSSGRRHSTDWKAASSCVSQPKSARRSRRAQLENRAFWVRLFRVRLGCLGEVVPSEVRSSARRVRSRPPPLTPADGHCRCFWLRHRPKRRAPCARRHRASEHACPTSGLLCGRLLVALCASPPT